MAIAASDIDHLVAGVIEREGDYTNNPADLGGPTRWGVTEQRARAFGFAGPIKALPQSTAAAIYKASYWLDPGFDKVAARFPSVAAELFDIGVNMGIGVAGGFLQRCLNVLNGGASIYPDLVVDNLCGRMTFAALDAYHRRGPDCEPLLLEAVRCLRGARYIEISEARPANEAFTYGWFGRMVAMLKGVVA